MPRTKRIATATIAAAAVPVHVAAIALRIPMPTSTGKVHVASAIGVYAAWLLHESGPVPDDCGAWQVGAWDTPKGDIAPAMPAVWRYQIYPRKENNASTKR